MARHAQKASASMMTCPSCKSGDCDKCVNILLAKARRPAACQCNKRAHNA